MVHLRKALKQKTLAPTLALVAVVLLTSRMGAVDGGHFVREWALTFFILAALALSASIVGAFRGVGSQWSAAALGLFAAYTAWTFASLLWSPNQGDAWLGAAQTLLYLFTFGLAVALNAGGASQRWVLAASVFGPSMVAAFTLQALVNNPDTLFDLEQGRLVGTVGYYNGEAAFLLTPVWVAIYLAGSQRINPVLRGLILAGAILCVEVATLTQSRGALVAMAVSLPVFFIFSGQRLRGFLALIPVSAALLISFAYLNEVYLSFLSQGDTAAAFEQIVPVIWLSSGGAGIYGLFWGIIDRWWTPPSDLVRAAGIAVLVVLLVTGVAGGIVFGERVGNPLAWTMQKWEAFKANDTTGEEQSRYLSASGTGRYTLWQVAWKDFTANPVLGVGTHNYEATYYHLRERSASYIRQPHNLPLEVLAERGVLAGVFFFGFLGTCLVAAMRQRFKQFNAEDKALLGATVAAVAYWFVHSTAEWFWQLPAVTLPAVIYLAVLVTPSRQAETEPPRWPVRAGIALGVLLAIAVVTPLYISDWYLAQSYATTNPWVALEAVERAQKVNPVNPQLPQREAELAIQIGDWPRVEKAYGEAMRLNPEHYAPYTLLAKFHEQRGELEKALQLYRQALVLNPLDEELNQSVRRLGGQAEEGGADKAQGS